MTNVFDKAPGGNTTDEFHAAVDGMGATFTVIEAVGFDGVGSFDGPVIVGGYNPQSWSSTHDWNYTPLDADRTAFVFNLTQGLKFDQRKDAATTNRGQYQTFNSLVYGPAFGAGVDLTAAGSSMESGYSRLYSYGGDDDYGRDLIRYPANFEGEWLFWIGQVEVFTVSAVPEPETWALPRSGPPGQLLLLAPDVQAAIDRCAISLMRPG